MLATRKGRTGVDKAKPFGISKREVWMAYKRVKENRGAAGVDDQTIAEFERDFGIECRRAVTCRHRFVDQKGTEEERVR
jgi:hypothetical protein